MADRSLKIAVDGRELTGRPTGVGRYLLEILRHWATADFPHRVLIVAPTTPSSAIEAVLPGLAWHIEPSRSSGTRWEQGQLARALAQAKPDVFFAPAYTAPLRLPCPLVATIHDVSYFAHPEWFGRREGWRRRWLTKATARRAGKVLTVSEFSKAEIQKYLRIAPDRIVVAPNGAPAAVTVQASDREPLVLFVGSLFNRRRIPDLISAFALVVRRVPAARLVLVGDNRTQPRIDPRELSAAAGIENHVECRDYETDVARDALYSRARAFVFLSDYEGFGLPPLEAMAHGLPSVVLDTAVSAEIYGDAALRVPAIPAAIADALVSLLTDDALRGQMTSAGLARLASYSWASTASRVRRVLEDAAQ